MSQYCNLPSLSVAFCCRAVLTNADEGERHASWLQSVDLPSSAHPFVTWLKGRAAVCLHCQRSDDGLDGLAVTGVFTASMALASRTWQKEQTLGGDTESSQFAGPEAQRGRSLPDLG